MVGDRISIKIMGQAQSIEDDEVIDHPSLEGINEEIRKARNELARMKEQGDAKRNDYDQELFDEELRLRKKKVLLQELDEIVKTGMPIWRYIQVVNEMKPPPPTPSAPKCTVSNGGQRQKVETRALVLHSYTNYANVFSFIEAFLLRSLHMAELLRKQRDTQSQAWNGVIVHLFELTPRIKVNVQNVKSRFTKLKVESNKCMVEMRETYDKKRKCLQQIISALEEMVLVSDDEDECQDDTASRDSSFLPRRARRSTMKVPQNQPNWKKSSRDKMSRSLQRNKNNNNNKNNKKSRLKVNNRDNTADAKTDWYRPTDSSTNLFLEQSTSDFAENTSIVRSVITDDEIEDFLYPARSRSKRSTLAKKNPQDDAASVDLDEFECRTVNSSMSSMNDSNSLGDEFSLATPASATTPASNVSSKHPRRSIEDIKRRRRDLEVHRQSIKSSPTAECSLVDSNIMLTQRNSSSSTKATNGPKPKRSLQDIKKRMRDLETMSQTMSNRESGSNKQ